MHVVGRAVVAGRQFVFAGLSKQPTRHRRPQEPPVSKKSDSQLQHPHHSQLFHKNCNTAVPTSRHLHPPLPTQRPSISFPISVSQFHLGKVHSVALSPTHGAHHFFLRRTPEVERGRVRPHVDLSVPDLFAARATKFCDQKWHLTTQVRGAKPSGMLSYCKTDAHYNQPPTAIRNTWGTTVRATRSYKSVRGKTEC